MEPINGFEPLTWLIIKNRKGCLGCWVVSCRWLQIGRLRGFRRNIFLRLFVSLNINYVQIMFKQIVRILGMPFVILNRCYRLYIVSRVSHNNETIASNGISAA